MILVAIIGGKEYRLTASQVVVLAGNGQPVVAAYEHDGVVVQSDAADADFADVLADLRTGLHAGRIEIATR